MKVENTPTQHRGEHDVSGTTEASFLTKLKTARKKLDQKRQCHSVPKTLCAP